MKQKNRTLSVLLFVFFIIVAVITLLPLAFGLFGVQIAQAAADLCSFFLAIPLCRSVLKTMNEDGGGNA